MRRTSPLLLALALTTGLSACGGDDPPSAAPDSAASFELLDAAGEQVGTARISFGDAGATVVVEADGLDPGYHGLHVHETGLCEAGSRSPSDPSKTGDFLSAGGHLAEQGQVHGQHVGDLPPLLVQQDGTARLSVVSDRLSEQVVLDDDGAALMVHSGPDNLASIPDRYSPTGPDEDTLSTGDAGSRVACAVLESS